MDFKITDKLFSAIDYWPWGLWLAIAADLFGSAWLRCPDIPLCRCLGSSHSAAGSSQTCGTGGVTTAAGAVGLAARSPLCPTMAAPAALRSASLTYQRPRAKLVLVPPEPARGRLRPGVFPPVEEINIVRAPLLEHLCVLTVV